MASSSSWTASKAAAAVLINDHEQSRFQLHHIDDAGVAGPNARNALQVVYEALDMQTNSGQQEHETPVVISEEVNSAEVEQQLKTIVASDSDVSNGFVKCGRSLPYVFEATETGVRKRSSKILPVCAVCGKRFVCVTTMKRHLVTHTGEKPFSCKVCGKQYTQKGNLRVHERTHRNDRPFECNICHQKFYRKEPMQKHQWRQHGIVHFKSRPPANNSSSSTVTSTATTNELSNESSTLNPPQPNLLPPARTLEPPKPLIPLRPAKPTSYTALVDSLLAGSRESSPYRSDPGNAPPTHHTESSQILAPPTAHQTPIDVPKFEPQQQAVDLKTTSSCSSPSTTDSSSNFAYSSILNEANTTPNNHLLIVPPNGPDQPQNSTADQPIKLKMKMAYARAASEQREQELIKTEVVPQNLDNDLNEMKIGPNEMVECQCKTCGNTFSVVDPYNFRCNNCNVKYTSLPTHLIADPLQCIGCCAVFPHKPALKAHQTVADKERPFRCCKCGYGFRQKAHLQKHQWRIHRRKLEPDPQMKEAEAFFEVMKNQQQQQQQKKAMDNNVATITMQDIINKSVEKSIGEGPRSLMKTSSKYYSEVLGLEYEPKSSSSEDDDSQPLDLSPAKKAAPVEASPATRVITFSSNSNSTREANPLLNQPAPLPPSTSSTPHLEYNPAWKKQKTSNLHSLPPISGLQKPMSLVVTPSPSSQHQNYKHSSWINNDKPLNLVPVQQKEPKHFRSHLELLKSSNTRTV